MRIYLLRHGQAERLAVGAEQTLTATGRREAAAAAQLLTTLPLPELVIHSPKQRACQTAEIVSQYLPAVPLVQSTALLPESAPAAVESLLLELTVDCVLLVSHLPLVADLVGWLSSGAASDVDLPGYPPAGLVALDAEVPARGCAALAFTAWPPHFQLRT